jgi:hypothetical protein
MLLPGFHADAAIAATGARYRGALTPDVPSDGGVRPMQVLIAPIPPVPIPGPDVAPPYPLEPDWPVWEPFYPQGDPPIQSRISPDIIIDIFEAGVEA